MRRACVSFLVVMSICVGVLAAAPHRRGGETQATLTVATTTPVPARYVDAMDWSTADFRPAFARYDTLRWNLARLHDWYDAQLHALYIAMHTPHATLLSTHGSDVPASFNPTGYVNGYPCGGALPSCCTLEHESHGTLHVRNPSGAGGLWQFMPSTWHNLGYSGNAADYDEATQNQAAARLFAGGAGASNWYGDGCYNGR